MPGDTRVYPAHDYAGNTVSSIDKERSSNPRLQVANAEEYAEIMARLKLEDPRLMDIVVTANEACGKL